MDDEKLDSSQLGEINHPVLRKTGPYSHYYVHLSTTIYRYYTQFTTTNPVHTANLDYLRNTIGYTTSQA